MTAECSRPPEVCALPGYAPTFWPRDTDNQAAQAYTKTKIFTVFLPQGAKKSVLLNPMLPLVKVLEKVHSSFLSKYRRVTGQICFARDIKMEDYIAVDTNGSPVTLTTLLGKIPGAEITFTAKGISAGSDETASVWSSVAGVLLPFCLTPYRRRRNCW